MAIAVAQNVVSARVTAAASSTQTVTGVTAGSCIVVNSAIFNTGGTTLAVSDSVNGTYVQAQTVVADASSQIFQHYFKNSAAGNFTVTLDPGGASADIDFTITELSGADTNIPLDVTSTTTAAITTAATSITSTTAITTIYNNVAIANMTHDVSNRTLTQGAGQTLIGENENNTTGQTYNSSYIATTTGAIVTMTCAIGAGTLTGTMAQLVCVYRESPISPMTFSGTGGWVCPTSVTAVQAQTWGGGAGGGVNTNGEGAGGGGAYSTRTAVAVTAGSTYTATTGTFGAINTNGGDSYFPDNTTTATSCISKGGNKPTTGVAGGPGGAASLGFGDTKFTGGNGGSSTGLNNTGGAGGGSSAGTATNGAAGSGNSGGSGGAGGTAPTGGGNGGAGGGNNVAGTAGSIPGGGGGGGGSSANAAVGARGIVVLTWSIPATVPFTLALMGCGY